MKIWKVSADSKHYANMFFTNVVSHGEICSFDGTPKKAEWHPLPIEIWDEFLGRPLGDITGFEARLCFLNEKALNTLLPLVQGHAEILEMDSPTEHRYALYVTRVLDIFDPEHADATYFDEEQYLFAFCNRYAFKNIEQLNGIPIFRLPNSSNINAFVTEEFVQAVEKADLTGLKFELIWDSEEADSNELSEEPAAAPQPVETEPLPELPPKTVLRLQDAKGDKFWQCECSGTELMTNYGKWGASGRYDIKNFETADACRKQAEKLIAAKKKQGYQETADFDESKHGYFSVNGFPQHILTAHPVFRRYCTDAIYYDTAHTYAPFCSSIAAEVQADVEKYAQKTPNYRNDAFGLHYIKYRWELPYLPPIPQQSDDELCADASQSYDDKIGLELMQLADCAIIAAGLTKFRCLGNLEKYEAEQIFRALNRTERLAQLTQDAEVHEIAHMVSVIRHDLERYVNDHYAKQYYSIAIDFDDFYHREIAQFIEKGRAVFGIPAQAAGKALAERVYQITEVILAEGVVSKGIKNANELENILGALLGHAICTGYGWHWKRLGEPEERKDFTGFWTGLDHEMVVPPDEMLSFCPHCLIARILSGSNIGLGGENDNTVLLLYNMLENVDSSMRILNPEKVKYYPIS